MTGHPASGRNNPPPDDDLGVSAVQSFFCPPPPSNAEDDTPNRSRSASQRRRASDYCDDYANDEESGRVGANGTTEDVLSRKSSKTRALRNASKRSSESRQGDPGHSLDDPRASKVRSSLKASKTRSSSRNPRQPSRRASLRPGSLGTDANVMSAPEARVFPRAAQPKHSRT